MAGSSAILWIDDEPATVETAARLLRLEGFGIHGALSGAVGLSLAESRPFDAILLDLRLPDMCGLDVLRTLRATGNPTPVLIVTGFGDTNVALKAGRLGATELVHKPLVGDELIAAVRRVVADSGEVNSWNVRAKSQIQASPEAQLREKAEELVRSHPRMALREISATLGVERHALERVIYLETRTAFRSWRRAVKVQLAADMIRRSDRPVKEIAWNAGYISRRSFSCAFRAVFGVTPSEYRRIAAPSDSTPPARARQSSVDG